MTPSSASLRSWVSIDASNEHPHAAAPLRLITTRSMQCALAAFFALALSAEPARAVAGGGVVGWDLSSVYPGPPAEISGTLGPVGQLAAAPFFTCAIQGEVGKVECWTTDFNLASPMAPLVVPPEVDGTLGVARSIAAADRVCAIQAGSGDQVCWAYDSSFYPPPDPRDVAVYGGPYRAIAMTNTVFGNERYTNTCW